MTRSDSTLKTAITRTFLWVVATIVATAVGFREYNRIQDATAHRAMMNDAVAKAFSLHVAPSLQYSNDRQWSESEMACRELLSHPMAVGAWVINLEGAPVVGAAKLPAVATMIGAMPVNTTESRALEVPQEGKPPVHVELFDMSLPLPSAALEGDDRPQPVLRLALQSMQTKALWYQQVWLSYAPLLFIGAIGSAMGVRRLMQDVVNPLDALHDWANNAEVHDDLPNTGSLEVGRIASIVRSLRGDRDEWKSLAERHARQIRHEVAQKTQSIYRELRRTQRELWNDPLTGLNNRRVLTERFGEIFAAQREAGQDLTVVMIDIDHFKTFNDTMGHVCGDEFIKFAADLIRGSLRSNDIAIRYGGDEFTLLLPSVTAAEAEIVAQRINALFRQRARLFKDLNPKPTLSAGIASLCQHRPKDAKELIEMADRALYAAKAAGRDEVATYDPVQVNITVPVRL